MARYAKWDHIFKGTFEVHIFVEPLDASPEVVAKFKEVCNSNKMKALFLFLGTAQPLMRVVAFCVTQLCLAVLRLSLRLQASRSGGCAAVLALRDGDHGGRAEVNTRGSALCTQCTFHLAIERASRGTRALTGSLLSALKDVQRGRGGARQGRLHGHKREDRGRGRHHGGSARCQGRGNHAPPAHRSTFKTPHAACAL